MKALRGVSCAILNISSSSLYGASAPPGVGSLGLDADIVAALEGVALCAYMAHTDKAGAARHTHTHS